MKEGKGIDIERFDVFGELDQSFKEDKQDSLSNSYLYQNKSVIDDIDYEYELKPKKAKEKENCPGITVKPFQSARKPKIKKRGAYRNYSFDFKQKVMKKAIEMQDIGKAASIYDVSVRNLKRWIREGIKQDSRRKKIRDPKMEAELREWIQLYCKGNESFPSGSLIRRKALLLSDDKDFKASLGWLQKFIIRNFPLQIKQCE